MPGWIATTAGLTYDVEEDDERIKKNIAHAVEHSVPFARFTRERSLPRTHGKYIHISVDAILSFGSLDPAEIRRLESMQQMPPQMQATPQMPVMDAPVPAGIMDFTLEEPNA